MRNALFNARNFIAKALNVVIVGAVVACFSLWAFETRQADAAVEAQILEAERAANRGPYVTDGAFLGSAQGYGGTIAMRVTIENGYIKQVEIVNAESEDAPYLEQTQRLLNDVVNANTSAVDVVSGATFTSAGILNGTTEALQKSNAGATPDGGTPDEETSKGETPGKEAN